MRPHEVLDFALHRSRRAGDPRRVRRNLAHRRQRRGSVPQLLGSVHHAFRLSARPGAHLLGQRRHRRQHDGDVRPIHRRAGLPERHQRDRRCSEMRAGEHMIPRRRLVLAALSALSSMTHGKLALAKPAATVGARTIALDTSKAGAPVDRFFDFSIGADYPGTLIRPDCLGQLKTAAEELGFRYIRFHAIFHDVLGTARVIDGRSVYDWTKIDQLYDALLALKIRPFVELGFTPEAMKTSDQTIFYWKGNTSHPKLEAWRDLVDAFVRHLRERYGEAEVREWFFEVWNEPNLDGFWERADQKAYFELYDLSARTIKAIDPALRVGGPSTAGAAWVPEFLAHVAKSGSGVDFVS